MMRRILVVFLLSLMFGSGIGALVWASTKSGQTTHVPSDTQMVVSLIGWRGDVEVVGQQVTGSEYCALYQAAIQHSAKDPVRPVAVQVFCLPRPGMAFDREAG